MLYTFVRQIIGPMADNIEQQFGDYSPTIDPSVTTTPLQGLRQLGEHVNHAAGCDSNACTNYDSSSVQDAVSGVDVVFACLGTGISKIYISVSSFKSFNILQPSLLTLFAYVCVINGN